MCTHFIPIMLQQNKEAIRLIKENKQNEEAIRLIKENKTMEMKPIIYSNDRKNLYVAYKSEYKGIKYYIVAGSIHPCAYVMCDEKFIKDHETDYGGLDCIRVHGGVTWTGEVERLLCHPEEYSGMCFGWDYGHLDDWEGYYTDGQNHMYGHHKYTTMEIKVECLDAIGQYLKVLEKDKNK